jgi:hydrogenase expression/formation protein HypE
MMQHVLRAVPEMKCARDPTRGGIASVLTELVEHSGCGIAIDEQQLPVDKTVQGICDVLGMDPIMMANEGKMIVIVPPSSADKCISALKETNEGKDCRVIGEVQSGKQRLTLRTPYGTNRIITMPMGNQLPRIC